MVRLRENRSIRKSSDIQSSNNSKSSILMILLFSLAALLSLYLGILSGMNISSSSDRDNSNVVNCDEFERKANIKIKEKILQNESEEEELINQLANARLKSALAFISESDKAVPKADGTNDDTDEKLRFGAKMSIFASGAVSVDKLEFKKALDYGVVDFHRPHGGEKKALVFYSSKKSLPSNKADAHSAMYNDGKPIPELSVDEAMKNCDTVNVVLTHPEQDIAQCTAIVGGYESYTVQHWMRYNAEKKGSKIDRQHPLVHVGRGKQASGIDSFQPPSKSNIEEHWKDLLRYVNSIDSVIHELKPIARGMKRKNTVITMVCNKGQATLMMNFVCSAKAKGFDISNVLVFATDEETLDLANGMGLTAYSLQKILGKMPTGEAKRYGDRIFTAMMFAKVLAVQLINHIGYDVLFMDVDLVWYKDPLELFHNDESLQEFDLIFQDDGSRSIRYAPFCANTGFYFVRHNPRTRYLFTALLYSGDVIKESKSHQQALSALLSEHSSLYGLKVKTIEDPEQLPGGYQFHQMRLWDMIRKIAIGKIVPWIFHMSWTLNKADKLLYMKQFGMWYLRDECVDKSSSFIVQELSAKSNPGGIAAPCCSTEPLITCYYRDKPSAKNCNDSPAKDSRERKIEFWKTWMDK